MVPSRVVRGGLLAASAAVSSLPFGFSGLLLQVIESETTTYVLQGNGNQGTRPDVVCSEEAAPLAGCFLQPLETDLLERPLDCGVEVIRSLSGWQSIRLLLVGMSCST